VSSSRILLVLFGVGLVAACKREKQEPKQIVVTPGEVASAAHMQPPTVKLLVMSAGTSIEVAGQNLTPGCFSRGAGVTVPAKNGVQDVALLRRCLVTLKSSPDLARQSSIQLVADKDIAYGTVIQVMDAARSTDEGGDLFPDVVFGPATR
jgi:hypothetical protein